jgi:hypothetical protein
VLREEDGVAASVARQCQAACRSAGNGIAPSKVEALKPL